MSLFIIAEISANHNNDYELTCETIKAAAKAGADAVKIQTFLPESLALDVDNDIFGPKTEGAWKGWRPWDLYQKASMPYEWQPKLKALAEDLGLIFFSSPFDLEAVDFLEEMNVPMYKIASFEINDIPLIEKVALTGKPVIISTGVATLEDIELALDTCYQAGNHDVTLLKCTSEYPATLEAANLNTILDLKQRFKVRVGLSDHSMGHMVPVVAVSLGAEVIEKHLILDRDLGGLDSAFSMEPEEFSQMVSAVKCAQTALGEVKYSDSKVDHKRKRSLFAVQDIKQGELFSCHNVKSLRPNVGLEPKFYSELIGKTCLQDVKKGQSITTDLFS